MPEGQALGVTLRLIEPGKPNQNTGEHHLHRRDAFHPSKVTPWPPAPSTTNPIRSAFSASFIASRLARTIRPEVSVTGPRFTLEFEAPCYVVAARSLVRLRSGGEPALEDSMLSKFSESAPVVSRRTFFGGAVAGAAALLSASTPVRADEDRRLHDPFIVLLTGLYHPVAVLPDLGLSGVNLDDSSYMTTKIYPIFGVPGSQDQDDAIGQFYVSFTNPVCVYDLPDGAMAMQFAGAPVLKDVGFNTFVAFPDGKGGLFLEGTFELSILDATGIFKRFKGGHNHMVDRLHQLDAAGTKFDEFCFCNISSYQFP